MIDHGKRNVLGVLVDAVDYDAASDRLISAARDGRPLAATALAVHGVVAAAEDPQLRHRINHFDLVSPDGMPVRWALNLLHGVGLPDRVAGPWLTVHVCRKAADEGLPLYLYGSRPEVLDRLRANLIRHHPRLEVAGASPSLFRTTSAVEQEEIAARIRDSGARLCLVGLGCPRQEVFVWEQHHRTSMPMLAVGAAFDFHAGTLRRAPAALERAGLEWAYRLSREPKRLARRYVETNPRFLARLAMQKVGRWKPDPYVTTPPPAEIRYG